MSREAELQELKAQLENRAAVQVEPELSHFLGDFVLLISFCRSSSTPAAADRM